MRRIAFVFAAAATLIASRSHGACTSPDAPLCATRTGGFSGVADFDQCRKQMLAYRDAIDGYAACVNQAGQASDEQAARDTYQGVWSQFNRRARETPE